MMTNTLRCIILQTILCIHWRHFPTYTHDICSFCTHGEHAYKQQQYESKTGAILEFATVAPLFIQPDRKISNGPNLFQIYCLLDQESYVASIELKNNVSVCLSLCVFDGLV